MNRLFISLLLFLVSILSLSVTSIDLQAATKTEPEVLNKVDTEIHALIDTIENSQCLFHRNGSEYSAEDAADHLRLKLSRGAKYAKTPEQFIDNLASKSSWSGKAYFIDCPSQEKQQMNIWFHQQLKEIRAKNLNSANN